MFQTADYLILAGAILVFFFYFFLMSDFLNLKLYVFLLISLAITALAVLFTLYIRFSLFGIAAILLYNMFNIGAIASLLRGKRTMKDATKKH